MLTLRSPLNRAKISLDSRGAFREVTLRRLVTSRKGQFRWRLPQGNPYILREEKRNIFESRYADLVFAMSNT